MADQESVWDSLTGQNGNSRRRVQEKSIMDNGSEDLLGELEEMSRLVDSIEISVYTSSYISINESN